MLVMWRHTLSLRQPGDDEARSTVVVETAPGNSITPLLDDVAWSGGDIATVLFSDSRVAEVSLSDGRLLGSSEFQISAARASDLGLSPGGLRLAVATAEGIAVFARNGDRLIASGLPRLGTNFAIFDPARSILAAASARFRPLGKTPGRWWSVADGVIEVEVPLPERELVWPEPAGVIISYDQGEPALYNRETLEQIASFSVFSSSADLRHDGGLFAAGGPLGTQVFDGTTGEQVVVLEETGRWPSIVSFSPDGQYLAAAASEGFAVVWSTETWEAVPTDYPLDDVLSAQFSADGRWLATVGTDGQVRLLDTEEFAVVHELSTRLEPFVFRTFGFIGSDYLLTFGKQGTELWDIEANTRIGDPFPSAPDFTARDAGDSGLITGTEEHILLWDIDPESWPAVACQAAGRNMTLEEWNQFGPQDEPYHATCSQWPALG